MARIVGISEAASIAIHVMVIIAKSKKNNTNVKTLSELTGASKNHIAKVMQRLVKNNYVISTRGSSGGFVLGKPAHEISMLNIYELIEGEMALHDCPFENQVCPMDKCLMNGIVHKVTNELHDYFASQKLSDYIPPTA